MRVIDSMLVLGWTLVAVVAPAGCGDKRDASEQITAEQPAAPAPPADLVLKRGKIVTVDPAAPLVQALAVVGDEIVAVGTDVEVAARIGPRTEVIDLDGKLAIPGFIDSHAHFLSIGAAALELDLTTAPTWDSIVKLVESAVAESAPGEWIIGRGWHQEKWEKPPEPAVEGLPTHRALSQASPRNPVLLIHASGGHGAFANAAALDLAGIDARTKDPAGGQIVRDSKGRPTGMLREAAVNLVRERVDRNAANPERVALIAARECAKKGVTTLHDAGASMADVDLFKRLADAGELSLRLWVMLDEPNDRLREILARGKIVGYGRGHLTVRAIKRAIDGALGSHGAWLLEPYADLPNTSGLNTEPLDALETTARLAIEHEFQLCVHAIGDRGNREVLDIYERVLGDHPTVEDARFRVEHAQHLDPADLPRFARLGVIAAMQPNHCTSDGPWVPTRLGAERAAKGSYAWKSLLDSGARIAAGTDAPIENVDPIRNFHAAVTRQMKNGERFTPDQRMTREQALRAYTIDAAYAGFEERIKGSLTPGKLADIVVLSKDITAVPEDNIPSARVVYTIVGGKIVYSDL